MVNTKYKEDREKYLQELKDTLLYSGFTVIKDTKQLTRYKRVRPNRTVVLTIFKNLGNIELEQTQLSRWDANDETASVLLRVMD